MRRLSGVELVGMLNEGGWVVAGGNLAPDPRFLKPSVIGARISQGEWGERLQIETVGQNYNVPTDHIVFNSGCYVEIWQTLEDQRNRMMKYGVWLGVTSPNVELLFVNPALKALALKKQQEEIERRKSEHRRKLQAQMEAFVAELTKSFVGKTGAEVEVAGTNDPEVRLRFTDGSVITISSFTDSDYGCAVINGIRIDNFIH